MIEVEPVTTSPPSAAVPPPAEAAPHGRILILSASAGAGHMMAAEALRTTFAAHSPRSEVEVVDVLQMSNPFFRRLYAQGYLALVNHAPSAMGWLYEALDRPNQEYRDRLRTLFQNVNTRSTIAYLTRTQPDLIVNTHFLSAEIVAELRRRGVLKCPQVTVTTDFETHRLWVQSPTEHYYTASEEGKAYVMEWGVPSADVTVTGIPVRPAFNAPLDPAMLRKRYDLAPDQPVVLMLCGGFGVGPTLELLRELLRTPDHVQLVVVTGQNERLRRRFDHIARGRPRTIRVLGHTDRMHELMRAADLVVTKPGGLTVSEALVCGLPMVVVNPIPGQEARNSDFLLERGAGIKVNNPRLLGYRIMRLLQQPERLARLRIAALALGRPDAADLIAADALKLLVKSPV